MGLGTRIREARFDLHVRAQRASAALRIDSIYEELLALATCGSIETAVVRRECQWHHGFVCGYVRMRRERATFGVEMEHGSLAILRIRDVDEKPWSVDWLMVCLFVSAGMAINVHRPELILRPGTGQTAFRAQRSPPLQR